MDMLSRIEEILLLAIWKLKDNAYGISITHQVERDTGVKWVSGAIYAPLNRLIDANFDLRAKLYRIGERNLEMVETARRVGASANFAGSGGAIVGAYEDEEMYRRLEAEFSKIGIGIVKPQVVTPV